MGLHKGMLAIGLAMAVPAAVGLVLSVALVARFGIAGAGIAYVVTSAVACAASHQSIRFQIGF